jgi:hypothetical protein
MFTSSYINTRLADVTYQYHQLHNTSFGVLMVCLLVEFTILHLEMLYSKSVFFFFMWVHQE